MEVANVTGPSDEGGSGSGVLLLLFAIAVALALGFAAIALRRRHQRRRVEGIWRRRDADWEAVVRRIESERVLSTPQSSPEREKVDVG